MAPPGGLARSSVAQLVINLRTQNSHRPVIRAPSTICYIPQNAPVGFRATISANSQVPFQLNTYDADNVCTLIDRLIDCLINWLIDCLIDWLTDRLIDWIVGRLIDCSIDWLIVRLIVWLIVRLIVWLIVWLIDWLIDWLTVRLMDRLLFDWSNDWLNVVFCGYTIIENLAFLQSGPGGRFTYSVGGVFGNYFQVTPEGYIQCIRPGFSSQPSRENIKISITCSEQDTAEVFNSDPLDITIVVSKINEHTPKLQQYNPVELRAGPPDGRPVVTVRCSYLHDTENLHGSQS